MRFGIYSLAGLVRNQLGQDPLTGSHDAAEMTAAMYSFMATCKKNGVNELDWLTYVFDKIQDYNHKDLYQLLPNNWEKYKA